MTKANGYVRWSGLLGVVVAIVTAGWTLFAWHSADAKDDRRAIVRSIEKLEGKVDTLLIQKQ